MTEEEYEKVKKGLYGPPKRQPPKPPIAKKKKKRHNPFKDGSTPTSRSYGTGP